MERLTQPIRGDSIDHLYGRCYAGAVQPRGETSGGDADLTGVFLSTLSITYDVNAYVGAMAMYRNTTRSW